MATMHAMVLDVPRGLLTLRERPVPQAGPGELLVEVKACGVCRTDLHVVDGELPHPQLPIVPGHEVVGRVVCGGIHMSDIPAFPYALLWGERHLMSVANLTRADAREFLDIAPKAGVQCAVTRYPLERANDALADLRDGKLQGAAVLIP